MDQDTPSFWQKIIHKLFGRRSALDVIEEAKEDGIIKADEEIMLRGVLTLRSTLISDIMTPRTSIEALPHTATLYEVALFIKEMGYSRIPLYQDTKDHITGIIYARDIIHTVLDEKNHANPSINYAREPFFITENHSVHALLHTFKKLHCHIAIVLDEYGGTAGLVTVADILEPVFGEISDEYDILTPNETIQKINDSTYILPGQTTLKELESIGIVIHSEVVDTIGGYIATIADAIPLKGAQYTIGNSTFTVLESNKKYIRQLKVVLHHAEE